MDRRALMALLESGLPARAERVRHPDHPLLFRGPDLLALGEPRQLTALFISSKRQRHTAPSELSRYLLSRLAYPEDTLFVLALEDGMEVSDSYRVLFDEIIRLREGRRPRVPLRRRGPNESSEALLGIRSSHHERFAITWSSTVSGERQGNRETRTPSTAQFTLDRTTQGRQRLQLEPIGNESSTERRLDVGEPLGVIVRSRARRQKRAPSLRELLVRATLTATRADYALDADPGVLPDLSELLLAGNLRLQIHENQETSRPRSRAFDAMKPLRAAAFAGFETISEETTG